MGLSGSSPPPLDHPLATTTTNCSNVLLVTHRQACVLLSSPDIDPGKADGYAALIVCSTIAVGVAVSFVPWLRQVKAYRNNTRLRSTEQA